MVYFCYIEIWKDTGRSWKPPSTRWQSGEGYRDKKHVGFPRKAIGCLAGGENQTRRWLTAVGCSKFENDRCCLELGGYRIL